jgi:SAM-dependent methyltransferase
VEFAMTADPKRDAETIRETVREGYGRIARSSSSMPLFESTLPTAAPLPAAPPSTCCEPSPSDSADGCGDMKGGCCSSAPDPEGLAKALGYTMAELAELPSGVNLGLSCGNPTALAALKSGEVLLDLGSGAGFDVFVASRKVGPRGRAIGVDMTPDMVKRARANIASWRSRTGLDNVEFRLGEIEHLPVADASVDALVSNCVLNLSPDQSQVWREVARVLKRGGRVAVSDLALLRPLPSAVASRIDALIGCVAGASLVTEIERMAKAAGLVDVVLTTKSDYVAALESLDDPLYAQIAKLLPAGTTTKDFVTSVLVAARKP